MAAEGVDGGKDDANILPMPQRLTSGRRVHWKGKGASSASAKEGPWFKVLEAMAAPVQQLTATYHGGLGVVVRNATQDQLDLLNRGCFGRQVFLLPPQPQVQHSVLLSAPPHGDTSTPTQRNVLLRAAHSDTCPPELQHSVLLQSAPHGDTCPPQLQHSVLLSAPPHGDTSPPTQRNVLLPAPHGGACPCVAKKNGTLDEDDHQEEEEEPRGISLYLSAEEAFFLSYAVGWLKVLQLSENGIAAEMGETHLWKAFRASNNTFPQMYAAYHHLRCKGWIVRAGIQYGSDFVIYQGHPSRVHSDFLVTVVDLTSDTPGNLTTWSGIQTLTRLCSSVMKGLLVILVSCKGSDVKEAEVEALLDPTSFYVEEVEVCRWRAERNRE